MDSTMAEEAGANLNRDEQKSPEKCWKLIGMLKRLLNLVGWLNSFYTMFNHKY